METEVCNSKLPLTYYSKGPSLEVVLKGQLLHPSYDNYSFSAVYNTLVTSTVASTTCGKCFFIWCSCFIKSCIVCFVSLILIH